MTRLDFWSAEAEPEGADGHFVLAGERRGLQWGSREVWSPLPPCLPPAPALRHGLLEDTVTARKGSPSSVPQRDEVRGWGSAALSPTAPQAAGGSHATRRLLGAARFADQLSRAAGSAHAELRLPEPRLRLARGDFWSPAASLFPSQRALPASLHRAATTPRCPLSSHPRGRGRTGHLTWSLPFPTQQSLRADPLLFAVDKKEKAGRGRRQGSWGEPAAAPDSHGSPAAGGSPGPTSAPPCPP